MYPSINVRKISELSYVLRLVELPPFFLITIYGVAISTNTLRSFGILNSLGQRTSPGESGTLRGVHIFTQHHRLLLSVVVNFNVQYVARATQFIYWNTVPSIRGSAA